MKRAEADAASLRANRRCHYKFVWPWLVCQNLRCFCRVASRRRSKWCRSSTPREGGLRCLAEGIGKSGPTEYEATTTPPISDTLSPFRSIEIRKTGPGIRHFLESKTSFPSLMVNRCGQLGPNRTPKMRGLRTLVGGSADDCALLEGATDALLAG